MTRFDPEAMIAAACSQTGFDDFGGDSFREGLEIFCESAGREAQLNQFGEMAVPGAVIGALSNRLKIIDWAKRHPEVRNERIEAPFIVIGIFRAGTTFLSYLLEKDRAIPSRRRRRRQSRPIPASRRRVPPWR